ncbi:MAG: M20/M25/M40 family metallo-hydrolase [candidate division WOR-3 bacterium]|nr:MAG: M20/M25/M40 family metallo-hydrolase [candidate division WOR-3 bacterium]
MTRQSIYLRPAELLQNLIRFDTTNPPGNEADCVNYINDLLAKAGFKTAILAKDPNRPNLIARLRGEGKAPALMLYGHVDVVTTAGQKWTHPPFEGKIVDDWVWGRGALDMKGGVAMMLAAFLRAQAEGLKPAGDIVFTIVSDEEHGGNYGAQYLVENYKEQFQGIRYAIGEFGGFTFYIEQKRFYLIQVAEKQVCWMKAIFSGPGGHGSLPKRGGATAKLGKLLQQVEQHRLPVHITPVVSQMLNAMTIAVTEPTKSKLTQLLEPELTDKTLDQLGPQGLMFDALLHHTVNVTTMHGGEKVNVIPSEIKFELDGRLLPGYTPDDIIAELRQLIGEEIALEITQYDPSPAQPDMGLFNIMADILCKADPHGIPVPFLFFGATDARFFSQLGIQTYGFLPMNLPAEFNFIESLHAVDERIPIEALNFGTNAIYTLLQRYGE